MAGTLTISTLSDGTNSTSSTNCIRGSAKAWVQFAGSSGSINASYNVSSVTRVGTGNYSVAFTNSLADGKYSVSASCGLNANWSVVQMFVQTTSTTYSAPTSSGFVMQCINLGGSALDPTLVCASVFR